MKKFLAKFPSRVPKSQVENEKVSAEIFRELLKISKDSIKKFRDFLGSS
jgi:hypothetical protein